MPSSTSLPPRKDLGRLQQMLLKAALFEEPLPGGGSARLADLGFILRHEQIHLLDEHLAGPVSLEGSVKPIVVVSLADVRREAAAHGELAYLRFLPPEADDEGEVWLTLEGQLAIGDTRQHPMGLSRLQVKLREVDGHWSLTGDTRALAG